MTMNCSKHGIVGTLVMANGKTYCPYCGYPPEAFTTVITAAYERPNTDTEPVKNALEDEKRSIT